MNRAGHWLAPWQADLSDLGGVMVGVVGVGVDGTATCYYNQPFNESKPAFSSRSVVVVTAKLR